ncbi:Gelsolin [Moelleriella libera RCEF 2490]|uniref:Gelsolin n=1 Tax=Moelleriella libera RCEF 2490 TaxID=1081109 RepID=A0A162IAS3_9HYPO|nr:Gelsolin [Moelleriella libera RCEF 2490]
MPPNQGLVHLKEYDVADSNVELVGSDIDHKVKYKSAATEPAWNDGAVGVTAGLKVWRIEAFQVVAWPAARHGDFYDGDSFIVLHSYPLGRQGKLLLGHDIFFWLGSHTTQDEAGTAAYKTVELDEFLHGAATQHREVQAAPSDEFLALFPRLRILSGGVRSGFRHVEQQQQAARRMLLRVFQPASSSRSVAVVVVHEVQPAVASLDDSDVFVLDCADKIWVWQGRHCSPMEKAKAAQVVHDMTLAKHVDVEVVAQSEPRSRRVLELLDGFSADDATPQHGFARPRPMLSAPPITTTRAGSDNNNSAPSRKLFRLSDASGQLSFDLVKDDSDSSSSSSISRRDLDGNDVFLLDDAGRAVWIWEGARASRQEKARWLSVAQAYIRSLQNAAGADSPRSHHLTPLAKVNEGSESRAFMQAIEAN